jgi:cell division ATPase MinD
MVRVIGIMSGKGGVGKTTLGLNIGAALAHYFKKDVTIVDCNVTTSHLALYLGMYYCPITLNKVLRGEYDAEEAVQNHSTGLKIIPASLSINDLEGMDISQIRDSIKSIFKKNDIILLDGSPGLGREAVATLKASDEILYVTNPYIPFAMDIVRNQEVVSKLDTKPLGIVVNMVHNKKHEMTDEEIEELTKLPVIARIPFDINVHKSLALKMPVITYKPNTAASKEIIRLASGLIGEKYEPEEGALQRFLNKLRLR